MLSSLTVQNFQSHKKTEIEFHPGVNVFWGTSDSGKSSLFRSVAWVATNRPGGESFRSNWGGETYVGIGVEDQLVQRARDTKVNEYRIQDYHSGVEDMVFSAIGQAVPFEVQKLLNLSDINFHSQHDPSFLLSSTAGEISRKLNEITKLSVIDTALAAANRKGTEELRNKGSLERAILEAEVGIEQLQWLDEADTAVAELEKQEQLLDDLRTAADELAVQLEKLIQIDSRIKSLPDTSLLPTVEALLNEIQQNEDQRRVSDELQRQLSSYSRLTVSIDQKTKEVKQYENQFQQTFPKVCPLCNK